VAVDWHCKRSAPGRSASSVVVICGGWSRIHVSVAVCCHTARDVADHDDDCELLSDDVAAGWV